MRVSVVICTYNRADALNATLDALRYQTYVDFEVVVVNGPSTDVTADVIDSWSGRIKMVDNDQPNLSVSRNLGIRLAGGDLVAFIDDDAIPEFGWLEDLIPAFDDPEVAGAGGLVFDHTGTDYQFRFSAASRLGEPQHSETTPFDDLCIPGGYRFPYLQGTNAVFRRDVLDEVGGFDETFDYYLDETDLCARIVDAGHLLRQLDRGHVHHKFLPSVLRNDERIFTRWYPVIKNLTYFGYRHALEADGEAAVIEKARAELEFRIGETAMHVRLGQLPAGTVERIRVEGEEAIVEGVRLGRSAGSARLAPMALSDQPFLPFETFVRPAGKVVVMVSASFGETVNGGIARFITDVAPKLMELGHEVRVVTRSTGHSRVDFENGIWVHRVDPLFGGALPGTSREIDTFASVAATEIQRISTWRPLDLVYGPAWDMEVLPVIRASDIPVAVFLATPVAVTNYRDETAEYRPDAYASLLLELERETFATADLLHADSRAVVDTIASRYPEPLDAARTGVAQLGSGSPITFPAVRANDASEPAGAVDVLFVGRLEHRKGIDVLFRAIELVALSEPHLRFTIAGAENLGEGQYRSPWIDEHREARWLDRVEFRGHVTEHELEQLYARAEIVVVPSRYESFGLIVVEAMRHGVPVIATTGGALPELVEHEAQGLLVRPGDAAALATALAVLGRSRSLRRELGAAAHTRYEQNFTIQAAAERLNAFLQRVRLVRLDTGPLSEGESVTVHPQDGEIVRLVLSPCEHTDLRIGTHTVHLAPTHNPVQRVQLPKGRPGPLDIRVMSGRVDFKTAIFVRPATG